MASDIKTPKTGSGDVSTFRKSKEFKGRKSAFYQKEQSKSSSLSEVFGDAINAMTPDVKPSTKVEMNRKDELSFVSGEVDTILGLLGNLERDLTIAEKRKINDDLLAWVRLMGAGNLGSQGSEYENVKEAVDGSGAVRKAFIKYLHSASPETRAWAASFVEQLFTAKSAVENILEALSRESDFTAASWMAESLSRLPSDDPQICDTFADTYKRFMDEDKHLKIARSWGNAGCQAAGSVLVEHLRSGDYARKLLALKGLHGLGSIANPTDQSTIADVMLSSDEQQIQDKCAELVVDFDPIAIEVIERLHDAVGDDDERRSGIAEKVLIDRGEPIVIDHRPSESIQPSVDEYVSPYTSDMPFGKEVVDCIDVENEARAFAKIAAAKEVNPPLAIGVFGEWGSGKTFFMERIYTNVIELANLKTEGGGGFPFCSRIVQIHFNAWHYMESNLWASLVDYIFQELDIWLHRQKEDKATIDALFDRLSTARQLKLESVQAVIGARKERERAAKRLKDARQAYERALARKPVYSAKAFWGAVLNTFNGQLGKADKEKLEQASNALGIPQLAKSAEDLNATIEEAALHAGRAKIVLSATMSQLGQGKALMALVVALLLVPLGLVGIRALLASTDAFAWMETINDLTLGLGGILAATAAVVGNVSKRAGSALNTLQTFQDALNMAIGDEKEKPKQKIAAAQREVEARQNEVEQAEQNLGSADERVESAVQDWTDATPRGRLSRFIREKVVGGDYARHLGIIAAIRKDFGQLAQMVSEQSADESSQQLYKKAQEEYQAEVARLISEASDVLTKAERMELDRSANEAPPRVPSFERIILYIDDLDRCPPDKVVSVLQAIHLLLCFKLFVVVVAVDARWISRALIKEYPDLLEENVMWIEPNQSKTKTDANGHTRVGASSHDYLEKIFQIPYWVRPMDSEACMKYVVHLTANDLLENDEKEPVVDKPPADDTRGAKGDKPQPAVDVTDTDDEKPFPLDDQSPGSPQDPDDESDGSPMNKKENTRGRDHVYAGMLITDHEVDMLKQLAQYAGASPRRSLRFINVYRLIKSSLDKKQLNVLVGDKGQSLNYRAIITQLAISTGAPKIAQFYFRTIISTDGQITSLNVLNEQLEKHPQIKNSSEWPKLSGALAKLKALNEEKELDIDSDMILALRETAPIARRYSFTARPA